ncbi:unnamed protein product [Arabidopsis thaliana]|uniref:Uncharacterized protein n=2 Tax=Arabidopsis thaliana TaxID=3702 RepID=A0A654G4D8_ARATH|nr:uncharacterized protein AT5G26955 [Arabidopsis thaliana]ANM68604.1 hypothetical protein AT5G26955 [Arabidopsis thaliana]VYS68038.1 unnamed protein product [Arabidopsis thaliana]|eukprot:NP_001330340.1 hypothetical protein AT5G26955 [Arabidopsis thaliana]
MGRSKLLPRPDPCSPSKPVLVKLSKLETESGLALCLTHHSSMVLSVVDDDDPQLAKEEETMDSLWKKPHGSDQTRSGFSRVGVTEAYLVVLVDHFLTNPPSLRLSPTI